MEFGVNIAIFDEQGRVLLTQREDFEVWCLPGGGMDEGETPYQAAVREAKEETGLEVRLLSLVGVYSYPSWMGHTLNIITFTAEVIGGEWHPQPDEVINMGYFHPDALPADLLVGQRERIHDSAQGVVGKVQTEHRTWQLTTAITRQQLYQQRDESGLGRLGFYQANFPLLTPEQIEIHIMGFQTK